MPTGIPVASVFTRRTRASPSFTGESDAAWSVPNPIFTFKFKNTLSVKVVTDEMLDIKDGPAISSLTKVLSDVRQTDDRGRDQP